MVDYRRKHSVIPVAIALLATSLLAVWAIVPRWLQGLQSVSEVGVIEFSVNVWDVTSVLPAIAVPVVLFYLFALTPSFRRFLTGKEQALRDPQFIAGIGAVYALSLAWFFLQRDWPVELILFPLILSALLTGRWVGLGLGVLTTVSFSIYVLIENSLPEVYRQLLPALYEQEGLTAVLEVIGVDIYWVFLSAERTVYIWAGLMAGLAATWLGARRFTPFVALLTGSLIAYLSLAIPTLGHPVPGLIVPHLMAEALGIGVGIAIALLIVNSVRASSAVRRAERAEIARMRAELLALRAQINPHFFFNALNTIRYFVRSDPHKARSLLLDLSELFQSILRSGEFVSLADELAHVEAYLNLEKARLGDRLRYQKEIVAEGLLDTMVPTLTLQPVIENAVIHGLAKKRAGGTIRLRLRPSGEDAIIEIADDGVGMSAERLEEILDNETPATSIGLRSVDRRLRALYGSDHGLSMSSKPGQGTCVVLQLPITGK